MDQQARVKSHTLEEKPEATPFSPHPRLVPGSLKWLISQWDASAQTIQAGPQSDVAGLLSEMGRRLLWLKRNSSGKIDGSIAELESEAPRLQRQTRRVVLFFVAAGGAVSTIVVLLFGLLRSGWLQAFLAGIAIGMSMLSEEFPVVLTLFMTMGAWRIPQRLHCA